MQKKPKFSDKGKIVKTAIVVLAAALIAAAVVLDFFSENVKMQTDSFISMGSAVTQRVYGRDAQSACDCIRNAVCSADSEMLSVNYPDSSVSRINACAGKEAVSVSDELLGYLAVCLSVSEQTNGEFSPLMGAVIDAWDIGGENENVPDGETLKGLLPLCDFTKIQISGNEVYLPQEGMKLHLGSVGKGIACDLALDELQKYADGIKGAVISVGGSVLTYGENPQGGSWSVGIRNPFGSAFDVAVKLKIDGTRFISTSGSYEKYFVKNGIKYHHILSGNTGKPVETELVSVSVVADSGIIGDALSTAVFLIGEDEGRRLLSAYGCEAVFIYSDGSVELTEGLRESAEVLL